MCQVALVTRFHIYVFVVCHSVVSGSATTGTAACPASLSHYLPGFIKSHVYWVSDAIQPPHPLLPSFFSCPQSFPASRSFPVSWIFTSGGQITGASSLICLYNEYSGLISFRIDCFDLLAVWGTLKSLLQHHSSKASIFWHSVFFMVQLPHWYMTTAETIALTGWTFVGKIMSLLFNILSRFVISFLPKSKCLLISWLQSPSTVICKPPQKKPLTVSTVPPSICHEVMVPEAMIVVF